jgi:AraC-like DNA-binding protein
LLAPGAFKTAILSSTEGMIWYDLSFEADAQKLKKVEVRAEIEPNTTIWCSDISESSLTQIVDLAKRLYMERENQDRLERFRLNVIFQELVYRLLKDKGNLKSRNTKDIISTITEYMEQHFSENISRDMLAEMEGLSPEHCSRLFKKETGKTLIAYLTDIRINHAKCELIRGQSSISHIAEYVGYGEQYYFSRKFKQTVGIAPTAYIRKQRNHVACLYEPYIDHMLALDVMPYASMIDKTHPLTRHLRSSIRLG